MLHVPLDIHVCQLFNQHTFIYNYNNTNIAVGRKATKTTTNEVAAWAGFWYWGLAKPRVSLTLPVHPPMQCEAPATRLVEQMVLRGGGGGQST